MLRSRNRWSRNDLRPEAGAEIIFLINIYFSQFGGWYDEEKPPLRHTATVFLMVLQLEQWQYLAGAGAGAEIMENGGAGAENR